MKWILIGLIAPQVLLRDDFEHRLGLVRVEQHQACLVIDNDQLAPGTEVYVTSLTSPMETFAGVVTTKVPGCDGVTAGTPTYALSFASSREPTRLAGAAIGVFATYNSGGLVRFRLTPAPTPHLLEFHVCSTGRGSQVRVVSGAPQSKGVVWSREVPDVVLDAPACGR